MKNGKNWSIINSVVEVVGAAAALIGIFTGMKAASYDEEQMYKGLEERYQLIKKEEV